MDLRSMLAGLPQVIQYVVVLGIVMIILYVCLIIARLFGEKYGEKQYYDNPSEYEKTVPDLFASTFMKRNVKKKGEKAEDSRQDGE